MEDIVGYLAGLDVHRDTVVATVRYPDKGKRASATKTFGTDTADLIALGDCLMSMSLTRVGLESAGVYSKPVFYLLEERIEQVWLLNAQHLKNVPGRKTDLLTELPRGFWAVYVPFGTPWYGCFVRRLAERPANLKFFLRALAERRH
jgi:hypothetical protein